MDDKTIKVTISKDANIYVETHNYKGEACIEAIKDLMDQFFELDRVEHKPEYYEKDEHIYMGVSMK